MEIWCSSTFDVFSRPPLLPPCLSLLSADPYLTRSTILVHVPYVLSATSAQVSGLKLRTVLVRGMGGPYPAHGLVRDSSCSSRANLFASP